MESLRSALCCCSYLFLLALLHYGSGSPTAIPSDTPILHRNSSNHDSDKTCLSLCKEKQRDQQLNACISHCEQQLQDSKLENTKQHPRLKKALTKRQTYEVGVMCVPVWNPSTHQYTVHITWTLSTEFQLQWVSNFRIERRKNHPGFIYFIDVSKLFYPQANKYSYTWSNTGLVPHKNAGLQVFYIVRVSLSQSYPGSEDRIDRSCLLDISPPAPRIVVNVTTTVEDIVWQNLGAVITGISAHWSLQNTTASTDPATLMYQYDIGDNTSSHSDPLEFSQSQINGSMVWNISSHIVYGGGNPRNIFIWVRTYYSTTVKNTAIHNDMETINVYSKWSDPVLLDPPLRSSTVLLSTTPVAPSSSIAVQTTTPVQRSLVSSTAVLLSPSLGMTAPIQAQSVIIISVSTVFGALLLLAVCTIVMVCVIVGIKRRRLGTIFKNGSHREEWLPVFNRNESLMSSISVDGPCSDRWEVSAHDVTIHEKLGEGEFGEVFKGEIYSEPSKGQCGLPQQQVAVKLLKTHASGTEKSDFLKEIDLMKKIAEGNNPHVVNMMGCVTIQEPLVLITEFVEYGDLHSYLTSCRKQMQETPSEKDMLKEEMNGLKTGGEIRTIESWDLFSFAYQIASGMEYLASLNVVHRDLACRNILIGHKKCLKITDFGMSRMLNNHGAYVKTQTARLPLKWMAIESILNREFTTASDVWSFGVTLWEICTLGGFPYAIIDNDDLVTLLRQGHRLDKPDSCPTEMYEVMLRCWAEYPKDRPSFVELHKIFDKMLSKQKDAPLYVELCEQDQHSSSTQVAMVSIPATCSVPSLVEPSTSQRSVATIGSGNEGDKGAVNPYVTSPTQAVSHEHLRPSYLGLPRQSYEAVNPLTSPSQYSPNTGAIRLTELFKNQPRSVSNSHIY